MNYLDLFSGIGGFHLGILQAGIKIDKCYFSEIDEFAIKLYQKRFPEAIPLGGIENVSGRKIEKISIITGGFPCQPFSSAGKRRCTNDDRYLWPEMLRVIKECKPTWVVGENVAGIIKLALPQVLSDLESIGYEVQPLVIPACAVSAPHRRDRVWILAHSTTDGFYETQNRKSDTQGNKCNKERQDEFCKSQRSNTLWTTIKGWDKNWLEVATKLCGMDDGLPVGMDGFELSESQHKDERIKSLGNSVVVPLVKKIFNMIRIIENNL
jgi:DNA (cytosine-5)-methyltransferase 1